jgi:hypothetical protein
VLSAKPKKFHPSIPRIHASFRSQSPSAIPYALLSTLLYSRTSYLYGRYPSQQVNILVHDSCVGFVHRPYSVSAGGNCGHDPCVGCVIGRILSQQGNCGHDPCMSAVSIGGIPSPQGSPVVMVPQIELMSRRTKAILFSTGANTL